MVEHVLLCFSAFPSERILGVLLHSPGLIKTLQQEPSVFNFSVLFRPGFVTQVHVEETRGKVFNRGHLQIRNMQSA